MHSVTGINFVSAYRWNYAGEIIFTIWAVFSHQWSWFYVIYTLCA